MQLSAQITRRNMQFFADILLVVANRNSPPTIHLLKFFGDSSSRSQIGGIAYLEPDSTNAQVVISRCLSLQRLLQILN
jgi:hypothetical protein